MRSYHLENPHLLWFALPVQGCNGTGMTTLDRDAEQLLFHLVSRLCERTSATMTTNFAFGE